MQVFVHVCVCVYLTNNDQECCNNNHKTNVDVTHRHNGQNEGDDEDD